MTGAAVQGTALPNVHHRSETAVYVANTETAAPADAFFPPNVACRTTLGLKGHRGFILRVSISLVVIAVALGGLLGSAAAQYAPPPPAAVPDYPTPPPYPYPASSPPYPGAQVYRDADGVPYEDGYGRPYFAPQPLPRLLNEGPVGRPPADIAAVPQGDDVTGTVRAPVAGGAAAPQNGSTVIAALPPEDQPEQGPARELAPQFRRQLVDYPTTEPAGTIIIDTPHTYLYLTLGNGTAMRYGIGVGREGFTWSGSERISRMKEWPDWFPPKEMIERQPYLPRFMAGGETNPLGARALYLGNTLYRIHGTNQPSTIGTFVSSGCIRLTNDDIADLYSRVSIGTQVVVLPGSLPNTAASQYTPVPPASLTR
jgi:lipoprotein-anchoring transpeptidase ErfK/SrfK